ncbi:unnamed protein product, partial [Durusdinium trenchii]
EPSLGEVAQDASQHGAGISVVYKEFEEYLDGDAVGPGKELRIGKGFKDIPLAIALTKRVRFCILASMGAGLKKEI